MKRSKTTTVGTWATFLQAELCVSTKEKPGPEWKSVKMFCSETGYGPTSAARMLSKWVATGVMESRVFRMPQPVTYYRPKEKQK